MAPKGGMQPWGRQCREERGPEGMVQREGTPGVGCDSRPRAAGGAQVKIPEDFRAALRACRTLLVRRGWAGPEAHAGGLQQAWTPLGS